MRLKKRAAWTVTAITVTFVGVVIWWRVLEQREQVQWDLSEAAERGQLDRVRDLIERRGAKAGAWPQRGDYLSGFSAINSAVGGGHTGVAAYLLDHGADIETPESDITSPLGIAIGRNDITTAKMLLERGADANVAGQALAGMNRSPELTALLRKHGAVEKTFFREVPPLYLLCTSRQVDDRNVGEFADRAAAEIRAAAESAQAKVVGPLHLIFRGRNPRREYLARSAQGPAPVYHLEVALPVSEFTHDAPPDFYYRTAIAFRCVAAETGGNRKTIGTAWWIAENAVFSAGLGPTYETREAYREWHGFGDSRNVLELQYGLWGHTRASTGGLDYGHDNRPYLREAYR